MQNIACDLSYRMSVLGEIHNGFLKQLPAGSSQECVAAPQNEREEDAEGLLTGRGARPGADGGPPRP